MGFIWNNIQGLVITLLVVVISLVLHEIAHGYVALWNGDPTAKLSGRLSLNPLAHFDPIGFIMLMLLGFGYAKPVPINPYNFKHRKLGIFTVAIAGVVTNLILAFISSGAMAFLLWLSYRVSGSLVVINFLYQFFAFMVQINLSFMLFNLLPIHPLDGFRIIEAFTRFINPVTKFFRDYGQYFLIALFGMSLIVRWFNLPQYFDVLGLYINTCGNWLSGLFSKFWGLIF